MIELSDQLSQENWFLTLATKVFSRLSAVLQLFNIKARNGWLIEALLKC